MINASMLLPTLSAQVRAIEADLRQDDETVARLRVEWEEARKAGQTAAAFEAGWMPEQVTHAASAWVLATALIRFCEDNRLADAPFIAGPGDRLSLARERQVAYQQRHPGHGNREWILAALESLTVSAATTRMFDLLHRLMSRYPISSYAAHDLVGLWRHRDPADRLLFDFTDGDLDTRFLGDLYQSLSESARGTYALLQTPEFVSDFLLDHTLGPAIEEFGLEPAPPPGRDELPYRLRFIDPACGSGTFVIGAFHRLLSAWEGRLPNTERSALVVKALESIHGIDKNPVAVIICRFRLLVAAMRAAGWRRISEVPALPFVIAAGDSLIPSGFDTTGFTGSESTGFFRNPRQLTGPEASLERFGSYHAVTTNPPYITVKDRSESEAYRNAYPQCRGMFSLVIPFTVRCFQLARHGSRAGFVGMIVANSFMKREFGRPLIEEFLPTVDLTHVIDTSGVYIPGHGTPTVILLGRARSPDAATIRVVLGARGEPAAPATPARGLVWQAITSQLDRPGSASEWVSVADLGRERFARHPWSLSGGAADDLVERMAAGGRSVGDMTVRVGIDGSTGADDAFTAPAEVFHRLGLEDGATVAVITGSDIRDWGATSRECAFFLDPDAGYSGTIARYPRHHRRLWPVRTTLRARPSAGPWYSWHQSSDVRGAHSWTIAFARVATHPHFAILRDDGMPLQSAPVLQLPNGALAEDFLGLAGLLNSSAACFWLRQHGPTKAAPAPDQLRADEPWGRFHEFSASHVTRLPLPKWLPTAEGAGLDRLAARLHAIIAASGSREQDWRTPNEKSVRGTRAEWEQTRQEMIARQEELDWTVYQAYGLLPDREETGLIADPARVPGLRPGERAFEIVLARRVERGETETQWFVRHGATPITDMPAHWPEEYRAVVARRIAFIEQGPAIGMIERPENKRRWATAPWDQIQATALRSWLLDRCEDRELWYGTDGTPRLLTVNQLADRLREDSSVALVARLLEDGPNVDLARVLVEVLADEHVPYLAQFRYRAEGIAKRLSWEQTWDLQRQEDVTDERLDIPVPPKYRSGDFRKLSYWRHRGRLDIPKERFISYPDANPDGDDSLLLGWAGWEHKDQALALQGLIEERTVIDGWPRDRIVPLLAGLAEVMPWVRQWHSEVDSAFGLSIADIFDDYLTAQLNRYQLTADTLSSWTVPPVRRGRPPKRRSP